MGAEAVEVVEAVGAVEVVEVAEEEKVHPTLNLWQLHYNKQHKEEEH
jgi:hypothetical protein